MYVGILSGMQRRISYREFPSLLTTVCVLIHLTRCLGHVVNLATVDVMSHITKIAAVETASAIWEFDPDLPDNRVLGGSLDVIAAIRTLAIKVIPHPFICYDIHTVFPS